MAIDRILTTHVGSLPRSPEVAAALLRRERGEEADPQAFEATIREGIREIVRRQVELGIDIVSDGEYGKISYSTYIKDRLSGFGGEAEGRPHLDLRDHPEFRQRMAAFTGPQNFRRMCCVGPVALVDPEAVAFDVAAMKAAVEAAHPVGAFLTAASPGVVASFQPNRHYETHEAYIRAVAAAMRPEYEAIAAAGFVLQLDCPDLAMSRHTGFQDLSDEQFLERARLHVEVLNETVAAIPAEKLRMHVCWGNYEGPHDHDIALERILPIILSARPSMISFESANPRHGHEWTVWAASRLPEDKVLIPGVIDTSTNFVEHPELVAQRIERFAGIVGRERVIAGSDCGFGTFSQSSKLDPGIAFKKLASLVEGARLASRRLWAMAGAA
jgi:5-methyltetrahydropteroyltriglutamate--homocysteine methyltransferase